MLDVPGTATAVKLRTALINNSSVSVYRAILCWETLVPGMYLDTNWHKPPTLTPLRLRWPQLSLPGTITQQPHEKRDPGFSTKASCAVTISPIYWTCQWFERCGWSLCTLFTSVYWMTFGYLIFKRKPAIMLSLHHEGESSSLGDFEDI